MDRLMRRTAASLTFICFSAFTVAPTVAEQARTGRPTDDDGGFIWVSIRDQPLVQTAYIQGAGLAEDQGGAVPHHRTRQGPTTFR